MSPDDPADDGFPTLRLVAPDGTAVESLAIFDPADCSLLAGSPDLQP